MYKSIHEIPTYNYYQCEKGDLTYLGRGFFYRKNGWIRKKRFENLKSQFGDTIKPDPVVIDKATKLNWLSYMQLIAKSQLQMIFATEDQKKRMLKLLRDVGLSFDHKDNCKRIQSYIDFIKSTTTEEKPKQENTIENLYQNARFINFVLNEKIDILITPIAKFIDDINAAKKKAEK